MDGRHVPMIDPRLQGNHPPGPRLPPIVPASELPAHPHPHPHPHSHHSAHVPLPHPHNAYHQQQQPYYPQPPPQPPPFEHGFPTPQSQGQQYSTEGGSPADGNPIDDPKRARACEACRGLKVRCDQNPNRPDIPCQRCAKAKRRCVITAPSRKRQKKTDSRVAELEKKIDALTASLQAQDKEVPDIHSDDSSQSGDEPSPNAGSSMKARRRRRRHLYSQESPPIQDTSTLRRPTAYLGRGDSDYGQTIPALVDESISEVIDQRTASAIFDRYRQDMAIHLPTVVFSDEITAEEVRKETPILFLSILVAASVGMTGLKMQQELAQILLGALADRVIRHTEKSIPLIQAILVATIWYRPPTRYSQMNFYQLTHIAAVMAIDIGMGKKLHPSKKKQMQENVNDGSLNAQYRSTTDTDSLEARRTWLGCYFLCANTSIHMRRPNLIRWNAYMDESLEMLESSVGALPTDKILCHHVKLQHINEEIGQKFAMDDPSAMISIADSRVQTSMKVFEYQLGEFRSTLKEQDFTPAVSFSYHVSDLYMHEVALHSNHNVDDFRAPFTEESLKAPSSQSGVLSEPHAVALHDCLDSVKAMFRTFLGFDVAVLRALPIFYFVRIAYGVVILIKLYFAVTAPNSEVGKIITKTDLDAENQIDKLLRLFHVVDDEDAFRPANRFLFILGRLRQWFQKTKTNKEDAATTTGDGQAASSNVEQTKPTKSSRSTTSKSPSTKPSRGGSQTRETNPPASKAQKQHHQTPTPTPQRQFNTSTPLHFLSDVATSSGAPSSTVPQHPSHHPSFQNQASVPSAYPMPASAAEAEGMHAASSSDEYGMGSGLEQAMDLTLGNWFPMDFSNMFNGDPMYGGFDGTPHNTHQGGVAQNMQPEGAAGEVYQGGFASGGGW
ncbi:MAG: hypothetical protein M1828_003673 [Chrysothrix sp. TS-e1954]|nr:MAG: hypothetical protein M1828_003673 [Chrysothrix sp. TS-e1954]